MRNPAQIAIVDYGLGNLFSVQQACEKAGMQATITSQGVDVASADGIILPGVGAFGDAMETLQKLGLVDVLRAQVRAGKPLMGICLGMQLLMDESEEFGRHQGLGLVPGSVIRFQTPHESAKTLKVPQVQWNQVYQSTPDTSVPPPDWRSTPLEGLSDGAYMYFVHSYYVVPKNYAVTLGSTRYGHITYCSSLLKDNIFACQFHPERSGPEGLLIYQNFSKSIERFRTKGDSPQ